MLTDGGKSRNFGKVEKLKKFIRVEGIHGMLQHWRNIWESVNCRFRERPKSSFRSDIWGDLTIGRRQHRGKEQSTSWSEHAQGVWHWYVQRGHTKTDDGHVQVLNTILMTSLRTLSSVVQ